MYRPGSQNVFDNVLNNVCVTQGKKKSKMKLEKTSKPFPNPGIIKYYNGISFIIICLTFKMYIFIQFNKKWFVIIIEYKYNTVIAISKICSFKIKMVGREKRQTITR